MSDIQYKIASHANKQENATHNEKKFNQLKLSQN